jgi:hypothetical protein
LLHFGTIASGVVPLELPHPFHRLVIVGPHFSHQAVGVKRSTDDFQEQHPFGNRELTGKAVGSMIQVDYKAAAVILRIIRKRVVAHACDPVLPMMGEQPLCGSGKHTWVPEIHFKLSQVRRAKKHFGFVETTFFSMHGFEMTHIGQVKQDAPRQMAKIRKFICVGAQLSTLLRPFNLTFAIVQGWKLEFGQSWWSSHLT